MSSSMAAIAYVLRSSQSVDQLRIRMEAVESHLSGLYKCPLVRHWVGDERSGLVYWSTTEVDVDWEFFARRGDEALVWVGVPGAAGGPETGVDAFKLGREILDGDLSLEELGCPFAVMGWQNGSLRLANDVYGLARVFHFCLNGGDVWVTRPGIAHIFMAEHARKNEAAWAGMAALGWALRGQTQLGQGRQVAAATRLRCWYGAPGQVHRENLQDFRAWFDQSRSRELPDPQTMAEGMGRYIDVARRWALPATADLSGGKDSRAIAAVGIASGAITQLRTIDADPEEARFARELVSRVQTPVHHRIESKAPASRPVEVLIENLLTQHRAWEGRYLAPTAFNAGEFTGFRSARSARFNGLGGEVSNGGNLLDSWAERLRDREATAGLDRMRAMARSSGGASLQAREQIEDLLDEWAETARDLDLTSAYQFLDMIYAWDRMPNWSVPYSTPHALTPYYSAPLIPLGVQRVGDPLPDGRSQTILISASMPQWLDVPFYKGAREARKTPFIWELENWGNTREMVGARAAGCSSFDPDAVPSVLRRITDGTAGKRDEVLVHRLLWEVTFDDYLTELNDQVDQVRNALGSLGSGR